MFSQSDDKMNDIMTLAHTFLQNFCKGNHQNQVLLHKQLNLFLTPGVCRHDYAPLFPHAGIPLGALFLVVRQPYGFFWWMIQCAV